MPPPSLSTETAGDERRQARCARRFELTSFGDRVAREVERAIVTAQHRHRRRRPRPRIEDDETISRSTDIGSACRHVVRHAHALDKRFGVSGDLLRLLVFMRSSRRGCAGRAPARRK
jgi:hypothetical protein